VRDGGGGGAGRVAGRTGVVGVGVVTGTTLAVGVPPIWGITGAVVPGGGGVYVTPTRAAPARTTAKAASDG
jgi:hypothetical protein